MRTQFIILISAALSTQAQPAPSSGASGSAAPPAVATDYSIVERGPHHRIWERTVYEPAPDGSSVPRLHRYTELATGLHYLDPNTGQWLDSQELVESFPGGCD